MFTQGAGEQRSFDQKGSTRILESRQRFPIQHGPKAEASPTV